MKLFSYIKSLAETGSGNSSKSFTLLLSAIISFMCGVAICFSIIYDVVINGYVKSDLEEMGIFMLCVGGYVAGGGVTKIFGDNIDGKVKQLESRLEHDDEDDSEREMRREKRKKMREKELDGELDNEP